MSSSVTTARGCRVGVVDGALTILPADPDGPPCRVVPGDGVTLVVDGAEVTEACELTGSEDVRVEMGGEPARNEVEVTLLDDGVEALVTAKAIGGTAYTLANAAPAPQVTLRRLPGGEGMPPPLETHDISHALAEAGVTQGVLLAEIATFLADPYAAPMVLARGEAPTPPTDAVLLTPGLDPGEDNPFHCVRAGTLLASKTPAAPGRGGVGVSGAVAPAMPPDDPPLEAGDGAEAVVDDDGVICVTATRDGTPALVDGVVTVADVTRFVGDIDVATGDVEVLGSLSVTGLIDDRRVYAVGSVEVGGGTDRGSVTALGSVSFGGPVLHATVSAGARDAARARLVEILQPQLEHLDEFCAQVTQIYEAALERGGEVPLPAIGARVAGNGFAGLVGALRAAHRLLVDVGDDVFGSAFRLELEAVRAVIAGRQDLPVDAEAFGRVASHAADEVQLALTEPRSRVVLPYLQTAHVDVACDLVITGQGIFTSELVVAGDLTVTARISTIRGGTATVGGVVRASEVGGQGAARTLVVLDGPTTTPDRFTAALVHPGVRVRLNGIEMVFEHAVTSAKVGVDDEGHIVGCERATVADLACG